MAGPFFVISLILVLSGALKVVSPDSAANALSTLGLPVPDLLIRSIGFGEMGLGVAGLVVAGSLVAGAIGTSYLAFALVSELLRRRDGELGSCGCFGTADTPPSVLHTGVNMGAAVVGFAAMVWPPDDLLTVIDSQPGAGVPFVALVLLGAYLMFLAFTALPRVFAPPAVDVPSFSVASGSLASGKTDEHESRDEITK